ncbi:hypothetical protein UFOVP928_2 [uncultured Caudovirales phage]|uniref:Uncharacterized protein n=1 Tax=uncultured Caudovirales phage TaxID=2100421 RepID=A0A6J5QW75_9CAUD|nr:hypothetical protein UFOVP578_28 [uncultured Caudovirales phage]CAB4171555.1 hypothetical protein UFOVP928_2 [uncultured Caudovirales phage]CAB4183854.1 hypothetical protein UFOVP1098_14 [uncultured Caudovirales phage]CAB4200057.1 hypothetical protein UFOVP1353_19 [uncultured Caudovirales phage]CAB4214353.1 hypothetical protein UFOVP1458_31 [uncultured Caudovirales phage]
MGIQYVNGRLVRMTDEEIQAAIDAATAGSPTTTVPKPKLTPEQEKSRKAFEANAKKEAEARALAEKNRVKAQTAWKKKDNDGDGIPNSIDTTPNGNKPAPTGGGNQPSPTGNGSQNGNNNMAANSTPVKDYINQQLRAAGLPDTPANRAMLRKEYMDIQETQKADTIKAEAAAAKETQTAADSKAAFDAIMKSIGGYETRAGTAKTDAMKRLADLYDPQTAALGTQKQDQLNFLQQVLGQAGTDINASEQNFLSNLKNPTAYNDVPLINMPQQQNALMAALQSQGADTGQVSAQSASDASMNDFMQQLLSRSNQQYGNAQTNYVDALRNAGMGAAKSGRDYLALEQPRLASGINSKFAEALASLNTNRASSEGDIMDSYQKALADAASKKVDAETNYPQPVATPATSTAPATTTNAVDGMGMTEEEKKRLKEALANFGNFGMGF